MEPVWIALAFALAFIVYQFGLPPLIGYLATGFLLNAYGVEGGEGLDVVSNLGVTLLLFTIGLKLKVRNLLRPEVWMGASLHMLLTVGIFSLGLYGLAFAGIPGLDNTRAVLVIAFALSFSSTVFAVKVLEQRGEADSLHGRTAIGILIMQDLFAVLFLTFSTGKIPSVWAFAVPLVAFAARPLLFRMMDRLGHGELMLLFGLVLSLGMGATGFEQVGLKPDLGALVVGALVADHPKAEEIAKSLLGFKDLFLVGFFLSIGLAGKPTLHELGLAALLCVAIPLKAGLFFALLSRFHLRARTSLHAAFTLANYSEFGLIVGALAAAQGWISSQWLVTLALAVSLTFLFGSPLNAYTPTFYRRNKQRLARFETDTTHPDAFDLKPRGAQIIIFGMGRLGRVAYDALREDHGDRVLGIDFSKERVRELEQTGRNVIFGDATDYDLWEQALSMDRAGKHHVELVLLAMGLHSANLHAAEQIAAARFGVRVIAIAPHDDEAEQLRALGVEAVFNQYAEAGLGVAQQARLLLDQPPGPENATDAG